MIDYNSYSKSLIQSFQKSISPEKDLLSKLKSIFNPEVHANIQLVYHRLLNISTGLNKTITDITSNNVMIDTKKPADIKGTVSTLTSILNDISKQLLIITNYNNEYPTKVNRKMSRITDNTNTSISESKIGRLKTNPQQIKNMGSLKAYQSSTVANKTSDNDSSNNKALPMGSSKDGSVTSNVGTLINNNIIKLINTIKNNHADSVETFTDYISEKDYKDSLRAKPLSDNFITNDKKDKRESSSNGGLGSLIGMMMKPLLAFTAPLNNLIPGMLKLLGMNKLSGMMVKIPGLGLLTTATAGVIAIDYLNKNPEAVKMIADTIGNVVTFTVSTLGQLLGKNLPTTAMTIGTLVIDSLKSVYDGLIDSISTAIKEGSWAKVAAELALVGGSVFLILNKLRKTTLKIASKIDGVFGVDLDGSDVKTAKGGTVGKGSWKSAMKPKNWGRNLGGLGKNIIKGGVAGAVVGVAGDTTLNYFDEIQGIAGEDRYKKTNMTTVGSDVTGGALQGASIGLMFGPMGAGIGAVAGGLYGLSKSIVGFNDAVVRTSEELGKELIVREQYNGLGKREFDKRSAELTEIISSETMTKRGQAETETASIDYGKAVQAVLEAKKGTDQDIIKKAEATLVTTSKNLQEVNNDVFEKREKILSVMNIDTSKHSMNLINSIATNAEKLMNKTTSEDIKNKRAQVAYLMSKGFLEAEARSMTGLAEGTSSYARGGDVKDGLYTTGENGLEVFQKKGNKTKVYNKADSNLSNLISDQVKNTGMDTLGITKNMLQTNNKQMNTEFGSIMEDTVKSLLSQLADIKSNKDNDQTSGGNRTNQQQINNNTSNIINNNNGGGSDSYSKLMKFIPRFA